MLELLITPIVTEKSTLDAQNGKYHFYVPFNATKVDVAREVGFIYGKKVASVNMVSTREKTRTAGRKSPMVKRKAKKKAIVTFANKELIDLSKSKKTNK
jgi:large subunit ribosomal protein L23